MIQRCHQVILYVLNAIFSIEYKEILMTIDDKVRDEEIQYDISRKVVKISALSSGKSIPKTHKSN